MNEPRHDDARTLETIADNLDVILLHYQAEQLRLIAKRVRQMGITLDEIMRETQEELELVQDAAAAREAAIAAGEAVSLRGRRGGGEERFALTDADPRGWPA
jgi:hypothetical protein